MPQIPLNYDSLLAEIQFAFERYNGSMEALFAYHKGARPGLLERGFMPPHPRRCMNNTDGVKIRAFATLSLRDCETIARIVFHYANTPSRREVISIPRDGVRLNNSVVVVKYVQCALAQTDTTVFIKILSNFSADTEENRRYKRLGYTRPLNIIIPLSSRPVFSTIREEGEDDPTTGIGFVPPAEMTSPVAHLVGPTSGHPAPAAHLVGPTSGHLAPPASPALHESSHVHPPIARHVAFALADEPSTPIATAAAAAQQFPQLFSIPPVIRGQCYCGEHGRDIVSWWGPRRTMGMETPVCCEGCKCTDFCENHMDMSWYKYTGRKIVLCPRCAKAVFKHTDIAKSLFPG